MSAPNAEETIANYIGGLILFANKPVRVGDFCRYGEDPSAGWLRIGTVEENGLISTRIRGIDRTRRDSGWLALPNWKARRQGYTLLLCISV